MALCDDLRKRVVEAVVSGGLSRNAVAQRFDVSIADAVCWLKRYETTGKISPEPSGGDRRSGRIEPQRDCLLGLIRRRSDITLLEIQERLIANCGERFAVSVNGGVKTGQRAGGKQGQFLRLVVEFEAPRPPRRRWPGFRSRGGRGFQEAGMISPVSESAAAAFSSVSWGARRRLAVDCLSR